MNSIIERAYQTFSKYNLKSELDVCTHCCVSSEEVRRLTNTPLRKISFELIYRHNTAATSKKPPIEEFKYYLPRYLELVANQEFPSHSIELSFKRFEHYKIEEFESNEINLIQDFGEEYFKQTISTYPCPENEQIDSILIMLFKAKIDIPRLLNIWELDKTENGNKHFQDLVNYGIHKRKSKLENTFSSEQLDNLILIWIKIQKVYEMKYAT